MNWVLMFQIAFLVFWIALSFGLDNIRAQIRELKEAIDKLSKERQ